MPMPHRTFVQVAKRRLVGTEGSERVRVIRGLLAELPDYRNGPYADIRKWLNGEIEKTRVRAKVVHRDHVAVRREGAAQIALVGPPNAGKSSLLQARLRDPDQDGRLPVHDDAASAGADADRRRARPARRDPGTDRGRGRGPRRRPCTARRSPCRGRDRLLLRRLRPAGRAPNRAPRGGGGRNREAGADRGDPARRSVRSGRRQAGVGVPGPRARARLGARRHDPGPVSARRSGGSPA